MTEYQAELEALQDEKAKAMYLYRLALSEMIRQPQVLLSELLRAEYEFCKYSIVFFLELTFRASMFVLTPAVVPLGLLFLAVGGLALRRLIWRCDRAEQWCVLAFGLGLISSVAIVFLDGSFRALTATWPLFFAIFCSGLAVLRTALEPVPPQPEASTLPAVREYRGLLLATLAGGGLLLAAISPRFWPHGDAWHPSRENSTAVDWSQPQSWQITLNSPLQQPPIRIVTDETESGIPLAQWQAQIQICGLAWPLDLWEQLPPRPFWQQQFYLPGFERDCILLHPGDRPLQKGDQITITHAPDSEWVFYARRVESDR